MKELKTGSLSIESNHSDRLRSGIEENFGRLSSLMFSHRGYNLSTKDVTGIIKSIASNADRVTSNYKKYRSHFARNRQVANSSKIFCLGTNCYSRSVSVRWGFKPYAEEGEKSHPFDLAVHNLSTISESIANDFSEYLTDGSLVWRNGKKFPENIKLGISYNHDNAPNFKDNDFKLLKERYTQRIKNFREDLVTSQNAVFICTIWVNSKKSVSKEVVEKVRKLQNVLSEAKDRHMLILLVISNDTLGDKIRNEICASKIENTFFIPERSPSENYNAFTDFHEQSGFEMELRISNKLYKALNA